ncbi:MAG: glutamine--fructose-6-phosphate transaminase (isomerizing) [Candidatus Beckwithbacteria bacterium]|nr:glutamine--fructose-6-phosphate transaminase (isomerizing) [Candidatus Beckwithbacteria bacterium]
MCGIFGVIGQTNNAAQLVLEGLIKLEYRGYDSWGISVKQDGRLVRERHTGKISQAKTKLPPSTIGLGHTRWATHGGVTVGNAHPHLSCDQKLSLVHNGIVENFRTLKEKLILNHKFTSETDTEVALHLIEEKAKQLDLLSAVKAAFKEISGMNALIVLSADNDELIAVKNGSPLIIGLGKNSNFISSDVWALLDHTNQVIFLEDNQIARITAESVQIFSVISSKAIMPKIVTLNWKLEQSRLGKFHHYMEKEIFDQPKVLLNLASQEFVSLKKLIKPNRKIYLLACGTAYYAALFSEYCLRSNGFEAEAVMASEYQKIAKLVKSDQLLLVLSQSGETIDVINAVKELKAKKIPVVAITNVLGSTLYRLADYQILLNAGQEVAVASTKAFTAKLAVILKLIGCSPDLIKQAAQTSVDREKIKNLAGQIKDSEHIFVIGRGLSYPIALEAALKIKEVSYIHAEGFAGGELKHGPIALIDKGTPCIIIAPLDDTYTDIISSAHELKARGGLIIGISPKPDAVFDYHLSVPDLQAATAIPEIIIAQLLAYDLAVGRGLNPDKPRNLAKSVTVK